MSGECRVDIALGERGYPIHIGSGLLRRADMLTPWLGSGTNLIVSDENVAPRYLEPLVAALDGRPHHTLVLPAGEAQKCVSGWQRVHQALVDCAAQRDATVIALGGGVIGDLAGFAAATYMRGIGFIQVPTSLLAQVDSSVGGKTGINLAAGKNLVGAFYQPRTVLIDLDTLSTLPARELRAGLAEVIKYGLIRDPEFISWLEQHVPDMLALDAAALLHAVRVSVNHKAIVVAEDEKELGSRALLNLGHTFGHAVEASSGYGVVLHGEAVAMGMVCAASLSADLGDLQRQDVQRVERLLTQAELPIRLPSGSSPQALLNIMALDKKNLAGRLRLVLLRQLGDAWLSDDVALPQVLNTLTRQRAETP